MRTPINKRKVPMYDELATVDAIAKAWMEPGSFPYWHRKMQREIRSRMPLLGRALDRLAEESTK